MRLTDLAGRNVAIWGAGREGRSAARAIAGIGAASIIAVDENPARDAETWREATGGSVALHLDPYALTALTTADIVVTSPGVKKLHPWLPVLAGQGVQLTTGTALWMAEHADHTIAVTGTKGKSTTAALIHHLLTGLGHTANFAGNIGTPLLGVAEAPLHVVELSSQQCHGLDSSPRWAVLTSLFPEHLDWHGDEQAYYRDKLNLIAHGPKAVVVNALDPTLVSHVAAAQPRAQVISAGGNDSFHLAEGADGTECFYRGAAPLFPRAALPLLGRHNARNLCLALSLLELLDVDCVEQAERIAATVGEFQGLAHRLQRIADPAGKLTFINDSLSTAPQSAIAALEAFATDPVTVILGGADRGLDYRVLHEYLADIRVAPVSVLAIPDSGPRIADVLRDIPGIAIEVVADLNEAVARARTLTPPDGVVLLSPAAPSFGRFTDHAHRAAVFERAIAATS
ncbi:MAG: UDP-N-acetylmuramoyl-L-alanine--D-glutamate ligase [Mycobacteriales bacterium]